MTVFEDTKLYAVIADPVFQLRTPELLNPIFEARDAHILAIPVHISADELPVCWNTLRKLQNLAGVGVAMPHKKRAAELCDRLDNSAARLGLVGAVRRNSDGTMVGTALEGDAFLMSLRRHGHSLAAKNVLLIGAGGVGTALAFALVDQGVETLTISNRDVARAERLVRTINDHVDVSIAEIGPPDPTGADVIINATSLGLKSDDPLPVDTGLLNPNQLIIDVIAQPEITSLLRIAEASGCQIHSGLHMITAHMALVAEFILSEK